MLKKPSLIVVTGRAGSGKTTLATRLAEQLRCPLISRDRIKEGALHCQGFEAAAERDLALAVNAAFVGTLEVMLRARVSVVAEAAFQHSVWEWLLAPIRDLADLRVVVCEVPDEVATARRAERETADPDWTKYHPMPAGFDPSAYVPPDLGVQTLNVDNSDDALLRVRQFVEESR